MDDSMELERKLAGYLAMRDCPATWAEIYKDGGMDLMREYGKRLEPEGVMNKPMNTRLSLAIGLGQVARQSQRLRS